MIMELGKVRRSLFERVQVRKNLREYINKYFNYYNKNRAYQSLENQSPDEVYMKGLASLMTVA